jgi:glycerol kinase
MSYQSHDLKGAFAGDGSDWASLRIDGGMVANDWMAQDLANILNIPVSRPLFVESTALGAAMLAAVGAGCFTNLDAAVAAMRPDSDDFLPDLDADVRSERLKGWRDALANVLN